jgi:hypothetical protein
VSTAASGVRHLLGVSLQALLIVAIIGLVMIALSPVYKPANDLAGGGQALAAHGRYPGTLVATPNTLQAGDYFDVTGCGYDRTLGNVKIGFTGGSWGSALDAKGCFTITDIPALSGDTLPAGTYEVSAYQYSHRKWVETGETTITVVP